MTPRLKHFLRTTASLLHRLQTLQRTGAADEVRRSQTVLPASLTVGAHALLWVQKGALGGTRVNVQVPATLLRTKRSRQHLD